MAKKRFQPCPNCGRRGLHYADHPHAQGWKDYKYVRCRFCQKRFKVVNKKEQKDGKEIQNIKE
jgi:hypothetical protein